LLDSATFQNALKALAASLAACFLVPDESRWNMGVCLLGFPVLRRPPILDSAVVYAACKL